MNLDNLEPKEWLNLNAKLQQKKNKARKIIREKGIFEKKGFNDYSKYKYFTEAQYKEIANEIFTESGLELTTTKILDMQFNGTNKLPFGRKTELEFKLTDILTGFYEITRCTGEGLDNADKAIYKAYTGALKYYIANNFLIPTGDESEEKNVEDKTDEEKNAEMIEEANNSLINEANIKALKKKISDAQISEITFLQICKVKSFNEMKFKTWKNCMDNWTKCVETVRKQMEEDNKADMQQTLNMEDL